MASDTVTVTTKATVPSFFLKVLGINSAQVGATAVARADNLGAAYGAAPFGVISTQPELAGSGCPCAGTTGIGGLGSRFWGMAESLG